MSFADKIENEAEEFKGKVKEKIGDWTDNESLQAEGVADQAKANAKQAGEHVKDAAGDVRDAVTAPDSRRYE
ncbi:hypothetical protein GCM10009682_37370 [Luedemannella flava]|uniref:CsbD-like domain-containing protein n=1 Tax=Luedemannella flava TaxID=349316 RepID=A0ABP4YJ89_9ACTN